MRVKLEIDTFDAFDYEQQGKPKYNVKQLRELLCKEIIELKLNTVSAQDPRELMIVNSSQSLWARFSAMILKGFRLEIRAYSFV